MEETPNEQQPIKPIEVQQPVIFGTQRPNTPLKAWQELQAGNERFVKGVSLHPNQDSVRRQDLSSGQEPHALLLACSDSRLAAEIIFDAGLGDMFVIRTAGEVIGSTVLGSIEFAVEELHVPLIVVLGHNSCGAVTATVDAIESGNMPPGKIRELVEKITSSVLAARRLGNKTVDAAAIEHVKQTSNYIKEESKIVLQALEAGKTGIVGAFYTLDEGKVEACYYEGLDT
ncbi:MAG: carbonic anhydrase [Micrococcaceae bacterium]